MCLCLLPTRVLCKMKWYSSQPIRMLRPALEREVIDYILTNRHMNQEYDTTLLTYDIQFPIVAGDIPRGHLKMTAISLWDCFLSLSLYAPHSKSNLFQ